VRIAVLVALAGCSFAPGVRSDAGHGGDVDGDGTVPLTRYKKRLTVNVGSPSPLIDFPASIVTVDSDLALHARADAQDMILTTTDGAMLDHEVVSYDGATGALEAWVRLPAVASSVDIELRYGGAPVTGDPASTWSSAVFSDAWHLADTGAAWTDSASARVVQASGGATAAVPATGVIGAGRAFDGEDDTATAGDPADGGLDFGVGSFSVGLWVNVTQSEGPYDMVIDKGGDTNIPGYCLTLGTSNWLVELSDGPSVPTARFGAETELLGHWNHLVAVIDREAGELRAYVNSTLAATTSIAMLGSLDTTNPFSIGSPTAAYLFKGVVDEVRVYKQALSASWIAAEYRNVTARSSFVVFGPEQSE
jgi:hypothetical protein